LDTLVNSRRSSRPPISQTEAVRDFYDREVDRYLPERYENPSCEQLTYLLRKRIVLDMLRGEAGSLLDVGCGPAVLTPDILSMGFQVACVDLSHEMLRSARPRLPNSARPRASFSQGDVTRLHFRSSTFDCVACISVLGYLLDSSGALTEVHRVLARGGTAILRVSNRMCPSASLPHWVRRVKRFLTRRGEPYAFRLTGYRPRTFIRLLEDVGFSVEREAFYDFRLPFIEFLWPSLAIRLTRRFQVLEESYLFGWLGAGLIVKVRKP
jgi:ubiquinone/menaquinone biosynthesis C-methylase UbiE